MHLYWRIGRSILERQKKHGWGAKVIDRLALDLRTAFPEMRGFSRANLMYMRAFAEAWPESEIVQQLVGQLTWGANLVLLTQLKLPAARHFYAAQAIEHGWSRNVLSHHIESGLFERKGKAITNFSANLPEPHAQLATNILKDPFRPGADRESSGAPPIGGASEDAKEDGVEVVQGRLNVNSASARRNRGTPI